MRQISFLLMFIPSITIGQLRSESGWNTSLKVGQIDNALSLSVSVEHLIGYSHSLITIGFDSFNKELIISDLSIKEKVNGNYGNLGYLYSFEKILQSQYMLLTIGAGIQFGSERIVGLQESKNKFVYGLYPSANLDVLITSKLALSLGFKQLLFIEHLYKTSVSNYDIGIKLSL